MSKGAPLHIDKYVGHKHKGGEGSKTYAKVLPEDLAKVAGLIRHDTSCCPARSRLWAGRRPRLRPRC